MGKHDTECTRCGRNFPKDYEFEYIHVMDIPEPICKECWTVDDEMDEYINELMERDD